MTRLQAEVTEAADKLALLYQMVENGLTELDDILKNRISALKNDRDRAKAALDRLRDVHTSRVKLEPELVERFSRLMRDNLTSGSVPFRKAYLRAVVDRIEVDDDVIRIVGDKASLDQAIAAGAISGGVRRSVPKWRTSQNRTTNTYVIDIVI